MTQARWLESINMYRVLVLLKVNDARSVLLASAVGGIQQSYTTWMLTISLGAVTWRKQTCSLQSLSASDSRMQCKATCKRSSVRRSCTLAATECGDGEDEKWGKRGRASAALFPCLRPSTRPLAPSARRNSHWWIFTVECSVATQ